MTKEDTAIHLVKRGLILKWEEFHKDMDACYKNNKRQIPQSAFVYSGTQFGGDHWFWICSKSFFLFPNGYNLFPAPQSGNSRRSPDFFLGNK